MLFFTASNRAQKKFSNPKPNSEIQPFWVPKRYMNGSEGDDLRDRRVWRGAGRVE
jgi:hypothetical protein